MRKMDEMYEGQRASPWGFIGGLLLGGLVGAAMMMLVAPQSGKRTRAKIRMKGIELRDQASDTLEDALMQTRGAARQFRKTVNEQAEAIQQIGQDMVDMQKERISNLVDASKSAVQDVLSARTFGR